MIIKYSLSAFIIIVAVLLTSCTTSTSRGGYIRDRTVGALHYDPQPKQNEYAMWSGSKDSDGYASGYGRMEWYQNGAQVSEYVGTKNGGKWVTLEKLEQSQWDNEGTSEIATVKYSTNNTSDVERFRSRVLQPIRDCKGNPQKWCSLYGELADEIREMPQEYKISVINTIVKTDLPFRDGEVGEITMDIFSQDDFDKYEERQATINRQQEAGGALAVGALGLLGKVVEGTVDNMVDSFKNSSGPNSLSAQGIMSCKQCRDGDYVFQGKNAFGHEVTLSKPCPYCNGTGWLKDGRPYQP